MNPEEDRVALKAISSTMMKMTEPVTAMPDKPTLVDFFNHRLQYKPQNSCFSSKIFYCRARRENTEQTEETIDFSVCSVYFRLFRILFFISLVAAVPRWVEQ